MRPVPATSILLVLAAAVASCADGPEGQVLDLEDLIVTLKADGTYDVRTEKTTRERVEQEKAQRQLIARGGAAFTLVKESSCTGASMWMFDQPAYQGHRICFIRQGSGLFDSVNFLAYLRSTIAGYPGFWGGAVRSIIAGVDPGYFRTNDPVPVVQTFNAWQQMPTVSPALASSWILVLTQPGMTQQARFSLTYESPNDLCRLGQYHPTYAISDGTQGTFSGATLGAYLGKNDLTNASICLAYFDWTLIPGTRYDVGIGFLSAGGNCRIWALEGRIYSETNHTSWTSPLDVSSCTTSAW
jgi:hypothetical protein